MFIIINMFICSTTQLTTVLEKNIRRKNPQREKPHSISELQLTGIIWSVTQLYGTKLTLHRCRNRYSLALIGVVLSLNIDIEYQFRFPDQKITMDIVSGQEEAFLTQLHAQLSSTLANFPFTSVTANLKVQDTFQIHLHPDCW